MAETPPLSKEVLRTMTPGSSSSDQSYSSDDDNDDEASAGSFTRHDDDYDDIDDDDEDSYSSITPAKYYEHNQKESIQPEQPMEISAPITSITGAYSRIEHKYDFIDSEETTLGTSPRSISAIKTCINRQTLERYNIKSIQKHGINPQDLHREVNLLKEVNHANIVTLVDVFEDEQWVHLVTELCEGGELFDKIREHCKPNKSSDNNNGGGGSDDRSCFCEKEAARVLHQILLAVQYLHSIHIAHRDIDLEKICYESQEEGSFIKIVDLSAARKHYEDSFERYMSTRVRTSYYTAPEILRGKYTKSCDLWSIGVVAFIMLCGDPPFNGKSKREVCNAIKKGKYTFDNSKWGGVSKDAKDFIKRLLQVNPKKRMTIEKALNHIWLTKSQQKGGEDASIKQQQHRRKGSGIPSLFMKKDDNSTTLPDISDLNLDIPSAAKPQHHRRKSSGIPSLFTRKKDDNSTTLPDRSDLNLDSNPPEKPIQHRRKGSGIPSLFTKQTSSAPDTDGVDNVEGSTLHQHRRKGSGIPSLFTKKEDSGTELPDTSDVSLDNIPPAETTKTQQHRRKKSGIPSLPVSLPPMFQKH